jgi:hypothetical protein
VRRDGALGRARSERLRVVGSLAEFRRSQMNKIAANNLNEKSYILRVSALEEFAKGGFSGPCVGIPRLRS